MRLASTYVGVEPFLHSVPSTPKVINRYIRKEKQFVEVPCPKIISEYNNHMGGVDNMDSLLGRYNISLLTTSFSKRIFHHLIDMTVVNAYRLYERAVTNRIPLAQFREQIAETLCFRKGGGEEF